MADIVITTDFSQVNQLNDTLKSTGNLFTRVVDSLMREETRAKRVTKALAKTTEENLALIERAEAIVAEKVQVAAQKREKARQREADRAEKEAKRIAAAAEKAAKAEAKLAEEIASNQAKAAQQSTAGLNQRLGVTGSSAMNSGAGFGAIEQEIERLRQKYDKIYAASQLYERSLEELNRAHMLGITSVKQHEAALEQLNTEYQQFSNAAEGAFIAGNRFSQHINQSGRGLNNFGMYAQQVGYQVGDFFVQVQSGTNVLVAFGQQATQLAGLIPGVWGAAIGIGISLATALGGAWMRTTEDFSNGSKQQGEAIERLIDKIRELRLERQMAATGTLTADEQLSLNEVNDLVKERAELQRQIVDLTSKEMLTASQGYSGLASIFLSWTDDKKQDRIDEINEILRQIEYERQLEIAAKRRTNEVRNQYRNQYREQVQGAKEVLSKVFDTLGVMEDMTKVKLSSIFTNAMPAAQGLLDKVLEISRSLMTPAAVSVRIGAGGRPEINPNEMQYRGAVVGAQVAVGQKERADAEAAARAAQTGGGSRRETQIRKQIDLTKELTQAEKDRLSIVRSVESSLEDGFMSMVDGTKSVTDSFKSMARDIIKELYRVLVVQRMVGGISSAFGPLTGPSTGSFGLPFGGKNASGGSMIPGKSYLVGEHGPELVVPRHSGTVMNANQTANALGGGSGAITVQNNITVTGSDAAMVRAEVAKMIPQITNATKAAVIDAKQRGGQMAAAFR